jgi:3D (Asp-Asp-Asp) domain-containing protein
MRLKQMLFLAALCGVICAYGWVAQQTRMLEQQCQEMEQEARLLEQENAALRARVEELKELHTVTDQKIQEWLDAWQVDEFEATFYSPHDDRNGLNSSGNPDETALGYMPGPGCYAVDFDVIPPHALMFVEGEGWGVAGDTGGAIKGKRIDIYRGSYDLAMRGGRQSVRVIWKGEDYPLRK